MVSVKRPHPGRIAVIASITLVIAAIHIFRVGTYFEGKLYSLYYSYFSDIIVPFGFYFLLALNDWKFSLLAGWRIKAAIVFAASSFTEVLQVFEVHLLGVTFDYLDIVMFGIGVLLAVVLDRLVLARLLPLWETG